MSVKITVTIEHATPEEAAHILKLANAVHDIEEDATKRAQAAVKAKKAAEVPAVQVDEPAPNPEPAPKTADPEPETTPEPPIDLAAAQDHLKRQCVAVAAEHGSAIISETLAKFGVEKLTKLSLEQIPAFQKALSEAVA